jgi:hypothetical protein
LRQDIEKRQSTRAGTAPVCCPAVEETPSVLVAEPDSAARGSWIEPPLRLASAGHGLQKISDKLQDIQPINTQAAAEAMLRRRKSRSSLFLDRLGRSRE